MKKLTLIYQVDLDKYSHCCKYLNEKIKKREFIYIPYFREYGTLERPAIKNEMTVIHEIENCPFCEKKFQKSLREKWFLTLEKLGFDDPWDQKIPEEFKTEEWWERRF